MLDYLENILSRKRLEENRRFKPAYAPAAAPKPPTLLKGGTLSVIAEVKRASPSRGTLAAIDDPASLAKQYLAGGAAMLSILTDEAFSGSLSDLSAVSRAFPESPILRKDFIVDLSQLEESKSVGATAVLLIVAVLGGQIPLFQREAETLGLDVLIEVHDEKELAVALSSGSKIIGVNNRNLSTFQVDLHIAERLAPLIPSHLIKVAESGIRTPEEARRMRRAGYDAVLVGEALVCSSSPKELIEEMRR